MAPASTLPQESYIDPLLDLVVFGLGLVHPFYVVYYVKFMAMALRMRKPERRDPEGIPPPG